ncbi:Protein CBG27802 [Caenorhabditis briggsae]|uniref:Protein CBG27802 n=1 Tax=Caenorhabditis briggsae TaxID=6238 RepID=B6II39_CAEBR|nr:Protein CBG27802 [Caenorhabditis briggsae]CAR99569.1 Protein CBG27802 [Caenorhabditis briggsae]
MDLVMVSRVRNRWIFFVIFVVLHRSLSVSMMRSTSLDTAKYSNYTCTEINNFGTDISSAIGVIRYLYIINTIIFSFKIVLCGSILLFYFGLMPEADLLSSASFCNIYALMSSLSAILRLIWNYKGLSVIMTFLTEKDPKFCKDMPSWMASNLTKMAYSVVLLIVEFGLLLREQEAMADYLKHWTDVRNVRRQEENTPNENCFLVMDGERLSRQFRKVLLTLFLVIVVIKTMNLSTLKNDDAIEETSKSFLFHDVFHCKSYGTDPSIRFENDESSEMKPPVMLDLNMFLMNIPRNNNIQVGGEILREDESLSRNDMELNRDNE